MSPFISLYIFKVIYPSIYIYVIPTVDLLTPAYPDSKAHGANMGPIWGRQDPGGPLVGPMNFAIWVCINVSVFMSSRPSIYSISS